MRQSSRSLSGPVALLVLCLAMPLLAFGTRLVIHFATSFTLVTEAPGSQHIEAEGGSVQLLGPPDVFVPTLDGTGDGVLVVLPNPSPMAAKLEALLDVPFEGTQVDVTFSLSHAGDWTKFVVVALDDGDGPMIDVESGGDGGSDGGVLTVDGVEIAYPQSSTGLYDLRLSLREPTFGPKTWTLAVTTTFGAETKVASATGLLKIGAGLTLGRVDFVRPAGAVGGTYEIDDLVVSSVTTNNIFSF